MKKADQVMLFLTMALVLGGIFIFLSASLGVLTEGNDILLRMAATQIALGVIGGGVFMLGVARIPYRKLKPYAPHIFAAGMLATLAVFVPLLGFSHGGATRWLDLGFFTIQPAEFLKLGAVIFLAYLFSYAAQRKKSPWWSFGAMFAVLGAVVSVLFFQPDTGTLLIIAAAAYAMFFASGVPWKIIGVALVLPLVLFTGIFLTQDYVQERVKTFFHPAENQLGSGWQINQSFIAIGSGGVFGRGFGQSVQKFRYLPEPTSDSIFAVYAEEFGFVGAIILIGAFLAFALRGLTIARRATDRFGGLLAVGIVILLIAQAFTNMAAMLGVLPLTGLPLTFVSHGGSSLFFSLIAVGVLLSISRYQQKA